MATETWRKYRRLDGTWAILHVNEELGSEYQIMSCGSEAIADMVLTEHNDHAAVSELRLALTEYMSQFGQALEAHGIPFTENQQAAEDNALAALRTTASAPDTRTAPEGER